MDYEIPTWVPGCHPAGGPMSRQRRRRRKHRRPTPPPDLSRLAHLPRIEVAALILVSLEVKGIPVTSKVMETPAGPRVLLGFHLPAEWTPTERKMFTDWVQPRVSIKATPWATLAREAQQAARWN